MRPPRKMDACRTVREALLWASSCLQEAGTKDPRFEAELLLRHCLGMDRTRFLASLQDPVAGGDMVKLEGLLQRRMAHEPIQYVLGTQAFYGREFEVGPGVLIPRPETEILVEQILLHAERLWPDSPPLAVADIGTGSGAISLTLASERPHWRVVTVDISDDALAIAGRNAQRLGVSERVTFLQGDLLEPLKERGLKLDILASNPPYIPSPDVDQLDREVRGYEPRLALDGGDDGLDCYRRICAELPRLLNEQALVGFEVGIHQARDVAALLMASGVISETAIVPDLAGIERVVMGLRIP
ncbi:peptide chain release factor N(5)-glutamine methyltransferase [Brevibacillus sp. SYP-B805]|uniref:peptide chain release factor N(5)-glutamine methyltransferase n=1 Tax=Brevibacillus sp. SYP-B805 TaxID=1578199 RepID=UPI0013EB5804|nr:peptide chain release factor N(5)-glutamine methyltransferase [Brevibacillus sp. SYP-B805]NGQ95541.1 peptide chain release factor N(5)-glutamine methyltransferase [Brevibacillus sp. SYP-B805]